MTKLIKTTITQAPTRSFHGARFITHWSLKTIPSNKPKKPTKSNYKGENMHTNTTTGTRLTLQSPTAKPINPIILTYTHYPHSFGVRRRELYNFLLTKNQFCIMIHGNFKDKFKGILRMTEKICVQKKSYPVDVTAGNTYYFCSCGLSKTQPFCDGAHKGSGLKSIHYLAEETKTVYFCGCKQSKLGALCDGTHKTL